MRPIFFAYPGGLAGVALLALRLSLILWVATTPLTGSLEGWATLAPYVIIVTLSIGFAARFAAAICATILAATIWPLGVGPPWPFLNHGLIAFALALIGPGAFSIDALLFGRRTMHLPG
jgi:hypothetical protein